MHACPHARGPSPLAATLFARILDVCKAIAHMLLTTEGSFKKELKRLPDPDLLSKASSVQKVVLCPRVLCPRVLAGLLDRCMLGCLVLDGCVSVTQEKTGSLWKKT